ncbi:hypothetical protein JCM8547_007678 [Rhodosporidiobolus lusitaniae]
MSASPSFTLSNPAQAWGSKHAFAAPPQQPQSSPAPGPLAQTELATSKAGESVASSGSIARRTRAEARFREQIEQLKAEMEAGLKMEDEASQAAKERRSSRMELPPESAQDAEKDVLRRELEDIEERKRILERILESKTSTTASNLPLPTSFSPSVPPLSVHSLLHSLSSPALPDMAPLATVLLKIKVPVPEKWEGKFDYVEHEAWIMTVEGYLASIGFELDARVDSKTTAYPSSPHLRGSTLAIDIPHSDLCRTYSMRKTPGASPASSDEKTHHWHARAMEWQSNHPLSSSSNWKNDGTAKPPQQQYCYNCGKFADHFSRACPNNQQDLRSITLAAYLAGVSFSGSDEPTSINRTGNARGE